MTRPWNLPNVPVYSLATYGLAAVNMNICTYVSPVSMRPKVYGVAVYDNTQTVKNLHAGETAVLQLLGRQHISLVNVLGKKSGSHFDKVAYLKKKKALDDWKGHTILRNCAAVLELNKLSSVDAGDHTLFLFAVMRYKANHTKVLTLDDLRTKKLIGI